MGTDNVGARPIPSKTSGRMERSGTLDMRPGQTCRDWKNAYGAYAPDMRTKKNGETFGLSKPAGRKRQTKFAAATVGIQPGGHCRRYGSERRFPWQTANFARNRGSFVRRRFLKKQFYRFLTAELFAVQNPLKFHAAHIPSKARAPLPRRRGH